MSRSALLAIESVDGPGPSPSPLSLSAIDLTSPSNHISSSGSESNGLFSPLALGSPLMSPPLSSGTHAQQQQDGRAQRAWPSTWGNAPAIGTPSPSCASAAAAALPSWSAAAANPNPHAADVPASSCEQLSVVATAVPSVVPSSETATTTHLFSERISPPRRPALQQQKQQQSSYGSFASAAAVAPAPAPRLSLSRSLLRLHNVSLCLSGSVQQLVLYRHWVSRWAVLDSAAHTGPALHVYSSAIAASRKQRPLQTIVFGARTEFKLLSRPQPRSPGFGLGESPSPEPIDSTHSFMVLDRARRNWMVLSVASEQQRSEWMDSLAQQMERVSAVCTPATQEGHEAVAAALFAARSLTSPSSYATAAAAAAAAAAAPARSPRTGAAEACTDCAKPFSRWKRTKAHRCGHCCNRFCADCSSSEVRLGTELSRVCNPCHRLLVALKRLELQRLTGLGSPRDSLPALGSPLPTAMMSLSHMRGGTPSPALSTASTLSPLSARSAFASPPPPVGTACNSRDRSASPTLVSRGSVSTTAVDSYSRSSRAASESCCPAHACAPLPGRISLPASCSRTPTVTPSSPMPPPCPRRTSLTIESPPVGKLHLVSPRDDATRKRLRSIAHTLGITVQQKQQQTSSKADGAVKKREVAVAHSQQPSHVLASPNRRPAVCTIL